MLNSTRDVVSVLSDLSEWCRDSAEGFRQAAGNVRRVERREARSLFDTYGRQLARFAADLETEALYLAGEPGERHFQDVFDGLAEPAAIRATDERAGVSTAAVLSETECGADALERSYAAVERTYAALERSLPEPVRSAVERQHAPVRQASGRVRALVGCQRFGAAGGA